MVWIVSIARGRLRRLRTDIGLFLAYEMCGKPRPRLIHLHVPKTAGTSVNTYLCKRIGWTKTGRSLHVTQMPWTVPWKPGFFERVCQTPYVYGHMSFSLVDRLSSGKRPSYSFTFLREPKARLWSFYGHVHTWLDRISAHRPNPPPAFDLWLKCSKMGPEEFFSTTDFEIARMIDNLMVRQLAGELEKYPIPEEDWPAMVDKAKRNVERLDFLGFQETFATDFPELLQRINIAAPSGPYIRNVTPKSAVKEGTTTDASLMARIERYTKYDQEIFGFALDLYNAGYWWSR